MPEAPPPSAARAPREAPTAHEPSRAPVTHPEAAPDPRASGDHHVRVRLADDLAVDVTTSGHRVHVAVDGSAEAVAPMRHLGPELEAELARSGFSLAGFSTRDQGTRRDTPETAVPSSAPRAAGSAPVAVARVQRGRVERIA